MSEESSQNTTQECSICLGPVNMQVTMPTCNHSFCGSCLSNYITHKLAEHLTSFTCPQHECTTICDRLTLVYLANHRMPEGASLLQLYDDLIASDLTTTMNPEQLKNFKKNAQKKHLKQCPQCHAAIEKNGGCNNMTCRCGRAFKWDKATNVVPCNQLHVDRRHKLGTTCPGCTLSAKLKLGLYRTAALVSGVSAAAVAAPIALVVAGVVIPSVIVHKEARRARRRKAYRKQAALSRASAAKGVKTAEEPRNEFNLEVLSELSIANAQHAVDEPNPLATLSAISSSTITSDSDDLGEATLAHTNEGPSAVVVEQPVAVVMELGAGGDN